MSPGHPLSFAQQRLWFLDQLSPGLAHYNCPVVFDIEGPVDLDVLRRALEEIVRRHEPLRTVFVADGGVPAQRVLPLERFELPCTDLSRLPAESRASTLDALIAREIRGPFDLAAGPIFRASVVHFSDTEHVLIGVIHHIAFDGWSGGIILRELAALYDAFSNGRPSPLAALPLSYTEFAVQQRAWSTSPAFEQQMAYWRQQLRAPRASLSLPADRPRTAVQSHRGHRAETYISDTAVQSLEQIGRGEGATPFMVLLAVYAALLHRLSGQEDILIGTGIANRNRQELEPMVGFFVNSVVIRLDLANQPSFRALLRQVRRVALDAYANQDVPFERLVEELNPERSLAQTPIAQAFLVADNAYGAGRVAAAGDLLLRRRVVSTGTAKFDAMLSVWRHQTGRRVVLDTSADLFNPESGEAMLRYFCHLVEHLSAHADDRLDRLPLASGAQRRQMALEWSGTAVPAPEDGTLVDLFDAQVRQCPDADAIRCGDECVSYAELDRRANRLAEELRRRGVAAEDRVGICLHRSPQLIAAVLATLKAGGAYVPLDPLYPVERLRFIAADAGCRVILTEASLASFAAALGVGDVVSVMEGDTDGEAVPCPATPASLAYVIYTSGSTGTPKGVAVEHRQVVNLVTWAVSTFAEHERGGMLASTSMSFDLSVFEWFVPLCSGGTVILVENLLTLREAPARERVTFVNSVPSVVREFLRSDEFPARVAVVAMAGELLPTPLVADVYRRRPDVKVFDLYGPTETTVYATCALRDAGGAPTIGRPIANTVVLVLDEHGQIAAPGIAGELFIGGAGVARGYLGRDDLTQERFVVDPGIDLPSGRMYRTGDRVRWRSDGALEFLGRIDRQVKVRGFRIELGEIETALLDLPDVIEAAVIKQEDASEHAHLVAFIVERRPSDNDRIYERLEARLPHYMVPSRFVRLPALPKQPNGKLDLRALQGLNAVGPVVALTRPRTPTEAAVIEVWRSLLDLEDIGTDDSFFRAGGHSLLATQLVLRLNRRFDVSLPIASVFNAPTVAEQASLIDRNRSAGAGPADTAERALAWAGTTAPYPRDAAVSTLFEARAANTPDALAIVTDAEALSYAQVNDRANQLAHYLRSRLDAAPDVRRAHGSVLVGLGMTRSIEAVIAQLAILKAGGAYVPLDPSLPGPRIETLLRQSSPSFVLTHAPARERFRGASAEVIDIDLESGAIAMAPASNHPVAPRADALAYVLFTSGTTGEPKAVGVPHRAIVRLAYGMPDVPIGAGDTVLQLAPLAFDASTFEIWCPLIHGARMALASDGLIETAALGAFLDRHRVTTMWLTASLFNAVVDDDPRVLGGVRDLLVGGEALSVPHVRRALAAVPDLHVVNGYGPTETTTFATCHPIDHADLAAAAIPIGRPLLNTRAYVLDQQRRPVGVGSEGELWIGGDGVALGYLNDAALTAERFVRDPFVDAADARLYRSGDRVRWRRDGVIEFLGRVDDQIKLRGFRIEPGEIEAVLVEQPGVDRAAVVAVDLPSIGRALAAFVVFGPNVPGDAREALTAHGLRDALRSRLPEYMVPAHWVALETLPLLGSGKTDRRTLASMAGAPIRQTPAAAVAPSSDAETRIAEIWQALLGIDAIGATDNFFDLGGHSLLATQVVSRIQSAFQIEIDLRTFFNDPTVTGLAAAVGRLVAGTSIRAPILPVSRTAPLPLSYSQQRIWFLHHWHGESGVYNVPAALRLDGDLDVDRLRAAVQAVVDRHEALRTVFPMVNGSPVQRVLDRLTVSIPIVDFTHLDRDEAEARALAAAAEESTRPFDLANGPLIRTALVRLTPTSSVLLLTLHHIVSDGWSMPVLFGELRALYRHAGDAQAAQLPPLPIQYADFAVWQRHHLSGAVFEEHLNYWRHQLRPPVADLAWPRTKPVTETTSHGGRAHVPLAAGTAQALSRFAAAEGATVFMVVLAAFQSVLHRHTGQDDVLVGAAVANRHRPEIEGLIGCFINTLVMRGDFAGDPTFRQLVARTRQVSIDAQAHQDLPFEMMVDALKVRRSATRSPLFQAMLQLNESMVAAAAFDGLSVSRFPQPFDYAKFEVTLELQTTPGGMKGALSYNADLFESEVAQGIADDFAAFLDASLANPDLRIADVRLAAADAVRVDRLPPPQESAPAAIAPAPVPDERTAALEHALEPLWCRVLDVTAVGPDDDFFELGGHSLLAVRLFAEIEREVGVRLPLSSLFRNGTIRAQARLLSTQSALASVWSIVVPIQPLGDRPPFFLVHGIGGEVVSFGALAESIGDGQPLFGLQAEHDVDGADDRIETVAARYIAAMRAHTPSGPYYLGGYSSGGVIAYEMAQQLEAAGERVALLAMLDAGAPKAAPEPVTPHTVWRLVKNAAYWTLDDEFLRSDWASRRSRVSAKLRAIRARGRHQTNTAALEAGADVRDLFGLWHVPPHARRFLERYMRMTGAYYPRPYAGTVTLFRARALKLTYTGPDDLGWSQLAQQVAVRYVPGAHDTILRPPRVHDLARAMKDELRRSATVASSSG